MTWSLFYRLSSGNEVGSTAGHQVGSVIGHTTKANTWVEYEKGLESNLGKYAADAYGAPQMHIIIRWRVYLINLR